MSYTINDDFHQIKLQLKTSIENTSNLYLDVYTSTNTSSTPSKTYTPTVTTDDEGYKICTFTIKNNDSPFNIGDVLDRFIIRLNNNNNIWLTNEGLTVLVDGEESDYYKVTTSNNTDSIALDDNNNPIKEFNPLRNNKFGLKFEEKGDHTVQVVYAGNDLTSMAYTPLTSFKVYQPADALHPSDPSPSTTPVTGTYKLNFVDKNLKTLTYGDKKTVQFVLTKGNQKVRDKTVEVVTPSNAVYSSTTNVNGIVQFTNTSFNAGKYKIGAYYVEYSKILTSTYKDITIKKGDPVITYTSASTLPVGRNQSGCDIIFKAPNGNPIVGEKISVNINGKSYTKKTNSQGKINFKFGYKGKRLFKVIYKGNKNLNKKTISFKKNVV